MRPDQFEDVQEGTSTTMWSVTWQAAMGREFFVAPALYAKIKGRLISAHRRPGRVLVDYLLLPAEIHVLSELPAGDSAGGVARDIGSLVARWVRAEQPVRSPVMAGPYRASRITSTDALRSEVRMLAWRPVFLGLCATPSHYVHGTVRIVLGMAPAQGFQTRPLLRLFAESNTRAREVLRRWIARRPADTELLAWELTRGLVPIAGVVTSGSDTSRTISREAASLVAAGGTKSIDGALRLLDAWVSTKFANAGEPDEAVEQRARRRALVACLAVQHRLCSAAAVARHFGKAKSTLSEQMKARAAREADTVILKTPLWRILAEYGVLTDLDGGR